MAVATPRVPPMIGSKPSLTGERSDLQTENRRTLKQNLAVVGRNGNAFDGSSTRGKISKAQANKVARPTTNGKGNTHGRKNSLRHTKNSTDALRERSLRPQRSTKDAPNDVGAAVRAGQKFTVGSVGNNGMIYLRPMKKPPMPKPQDSPYVLPPVTPPSSTSSSEPINSHLDGPVRDSVWTNTSTQFPKRGTRVGTMKLGGLMEDHESRTRARSASESTIGANSLRQSLEQGAFKVVIDRPESASGAAPGQFQNGMPTLEVPIPHYRLGTPRFSERGTAFLHNSIYTRTSTGEDPRSSAFPASEGDRPFPPLPAMDTYPVPSRRHSHASPQPYSAHVHAVQDETPSGPKLPSGTSYVPEKPITPAIYDELAANPNDPSVVRYSNLTGEIVAATPARLIAQITSENFLDYELLSDFFLTVRAYLSTHDLLAYLVARFEWAINRFDDNGRVIRVRAFAALRHWILNYFAYDFIIDRSLRVKFCQRLNDLTKIVRGRIHYGNSDMKLISDLKKCWNGRCIIYWDYPDDLNDGQKDVDIHPGGIPGSRDSRLHHPDQLLALTTSNEDQPPLPGSVSSGSVSETNMIHPIEPESGFRWIATHNREGSGATSKSLPISPISEQSFQVISCSIPAKSLKRIIPHGARPIGGHTPISNPDRNRACPAAPSATANAKPTEEKSGHKRSGSFSDAARDHRASLSTERSAPSRDQPSPTIRFLGSLIRGNLIQPPQPYVRLLAPATPALEIPGLAFPSPESSIASERRKPSAGANQPGVKNLLGTIRRALSRKYSVSNGSGQLDGSSTSAPSLAVTKSAALPVNLIYQSALQHETDDSNLRIDLLAADIAEAFHRVMMEQLEHDIQSQGQIEARSETNDTEIVPQIRYGSLDEQVVSPQPLDIPRITSGITMGSRSIVIVNDTGVSAMSGFQLSNAYHYRDNSHPPHRESFTMTRSATPPLSADPSTVNFPENNGRQANSFEPVLHNSMLSPFRGIDGASLEQRSSATASASADTATIILDGTSDHARASTVARRHSFRSNRARSASLRRYASFQSTFTKNPPGSTFATSVTSGNATDSPKDLPAAPQAARMLRRRPGGNLRANQNVQDLEPITRPKSTGSLTTYTESNRGSAIHLRDRNTYQTSADRSSLARKSSTIESDAIRSTKTPSYIRTHSSQPAIRRPSFEAAVAEFARIPDDDDCGLEATLLKLEGKYQKSPVSATAPQFPSTINDVAAEASKEGETRTHLSAPSQRLSDLPMRSAKSNEDLIPEGFRQSRDMRTSEVRRASADAPRRRLSDSMARSQYAESDDSYNSIPLLERDSHMQRNRKYVSIDTSAVSVPESLFKHTHNRRLDHLRRNAGGSHGVPRSSVPTATTDSFLLDDDESLSDLTDDETHEVSELSPEQSPRGDHHARVDERQRIVPQTYQPRIGNVPFTLETQARAQVHGPHRPPTPDASPISQHATLTMQTVLDGTNDGIQSPIQNNLHLPYIVEHESEALAQQFTIIEKDALNEIDWRDLVDKRWQESSPTVTNWVDYLRNNDSRGIDLVTARFNVVVKWALSEIMLTRNIEERAIVITKFIHVAHQSRKIRNFATLLQITIALTSVDCTRLTKTWELVRAPEKKILADLEALVTPKKNFSNLRYEMERANAEQGCIPVVALYIHDLTYNAQKSAFVPGATIGGSAVGGTEPLINFERHRTTAIIVKSLLQLIDASARYTFKPVEGLIEKCLWMAALPDTVIRQRSRELE
ncbi:Guanine nucleotide exchange factor lte1 [Agyrium rufum]|nr:Guanine nucleotide exchange factor lte1 [Agyrium rufum]